MGAGDAIWGLVDGRRPCPPPAKWGAIPADLPCRKTGIEVDPEWLQRLF